ncbi:MAG: M23 family metallopeptidase [Myxococcaceae bacterium]|nr:M23 family metallopeptidase [Myxococcaceae bacterium]
MPLAWPLPGMNGVEWVVNNYVDLDSTAGLRDWMGRVGTAAKTYDGHRGIDIDVPSFRAMDADFPVIAAAPGVVTQVIDGFADRNIACTSQNANLVRIRQDDCSTAIYAHFKRLSIRVAVGQRIAAGQQLGVVGSSGCSTQAHLHYELISAAGVLEEPFAPNRWQSPPPYTTAASVMDVNFRSGSYTDFNELKDPGADPVSVPAGSIGIASNTANGRPGDVISMRLLQPDGGVSATGSQTLSQDFRHSFWWWNRTLPGVPGMWTIEIRANGGAPQVRRFVVP